MSLSPVALAIAGSFGLANPPRPMWLGNRTILRCYLHTGGPFRYVTR